MKKEYEDNVARVTKDIIEKLSGIFDIPVPKKDPKAEQQYKTLRDTFDAFDKDGSLELAYDEYKESWKFMSRPGSEDEIKRAFDSVDIDGSGQIEFTEYAFSMMGKKAADFGPLA